MSQADNVGKLTPKINSSGQLDATTGLVGAVPIANGGTGSTTAATVAGTGVSVSGTFPNQTINSTGSTLNVVGTPYTLLATDAGKSIQSTGVGVTIPNAVLSSGNIVTIYNSSGSTSVTLTQGAGLTLQWAGQTSPTTGNRTLGLHGVATVLYISSGFAVISGAGLT